MAATRHKKIAAIAKNTPPNVLLSMCLDNIEQIKNVAIVVDFHDGTSCVGYSDMGNETLAYLLAVFQHRIFTVMSEELDD